MQGAISDPADRGAYPGTREMRWAVFARYVVQHRVLVFATLAIGLIVGIAYRQLIDEAATHEPGNYVRSGLHGIGIALAGWSVQAAFASNARSFLGATLRRLPVSAEILVRSLVMTGAFVIVGVGLQLVLYADPLRLYWFTAEWFTVTLPRIVALGFGMSLLVGMITEAGRLIGGPLLASVVLGTYHRPTRKQLIVMFLDLADSTRLAEAMGELRVHDLITRFFYDIDEPISDHGGAVHAYVGDAVIVTWPLDEDAARNARCLLCFFAIEHKLARLAPEYERSFGVLPRFRAGLHAGPVIVSECGNVKRQLACFGDTMNVAARLCEYCKSADWHLVASGDLLRQVTIPPDLRVGAGESVALRGRQERIETHQIRRRTSF